MNLQDCMTKTIEHLDADRSVYDAIEIMVDKRIRSLVVGPLTAEKAGVITARDIVFKILSTGLDPRKTRVSEIASKPLVCVDKDLSLVEVAQLMEESNITRVFICNKGDIIGVVSLLDVMEGALIARARQHHVS